MKRDVWYGRQEFEKLHRMKIVFDGQGRAWIGAATAIRGLGSSAAQAAQAFREMNQAFDKLPKMIIHD